MAVDVEWQDERGNCLARYDGEPIDSRLPEQAPTNSSCLRFLDPYGDATFNEAQVEVLERELIVLANGSNEIAEQAKSLLTFVRQMEDRTQRYLKFIGD